MLAESRGSLWIRLVELFIEDIPNSASTANAHFQEFMSATLRKKLRS